MCVPSLIKPDLTKTRSYYAFFFNKNCPIHLESKWNSFWIHPFLSEPSSFYKNKGPFPKFRTAPRIFHALQVGASKKSRFRKISSKSNCWALKNGTFSDSFLLGLQMFRGYRLVVGGCHFYFLGLPDGERRWLSGIQNKLKLFPYTKYTWNGGEIIPSWGVCHSFSWKIDKHGQVLFMGVKVLTFRHWSKKKCAISILQNQSSLQVTSYKLKLQHLQPGFLVTSLFLPRKPCFFVHFPIWPTGEVPQPPASEAWRSNNLLRSPCSQSSTTHKTLRPSSKNLGITSPLKMGSMLDLRIQGPLGI